MPDKLLKRYAIVRKLREDPGYFRVFLAHQSGLDRYVELRLLTRRASLDRVELKRFRKQFQALARLDHPAIVKVLDVGATETQIYYTTEYRNAVSLADLMQRIGGPLTRAEVMEVAYVVGSALQHLHDAGCLHRNLSMDSVFYDLDNKRPYLSEFSLMKDLEATSLPAGSCKVRLCTTVTPELLTGTPFDHLTDLFLMGSVLYQVATFHAPFATLERTEGMSPEAIFDVKAPSSLNQNLSPRLEELILKLLARDRAKRFQSANEFLDALGRRQKALEAESLINQERHELLNAIRKTKATPGGVLRRGRRLPGLAGGPVKPGEGTPLDGAAGGGAAGGDGGGADDRAPRGGAAGGGAAGLEYLSREWPLVDPLLVLIGTRVTGRGDRLSGLMVLLVGFAAGCAGFMLWTWSGVLGGSTPTLSASGTREVAALERQSPGTQLFEDEVVKVVANLASTPIDDKNFAERWGLLANYLLSLPDAKRANVVPYGRLLQIKLRVHNDPVTACAELKDVYLAADAYIKGSPHAGVLPPAGK